MASSVSGTAVATPGTPQTVRVVTGTVGSGSTPVRVLTGAQTVRLATTQAPTATIIRSVSGAASNVVTCISPSIVANTSTGVVSGQQTTIGGKQFFIQKPFSLSGSNVQLQLVKTSAGMAVQTLPKINVVQKSGGATSIASAGAASSVAVASGQAQAPQGSGTQQTTQIVTGTNIAQQPKTAGVVTGNLVKLISPSVGGNKILMKNSNLVQVGKVGANAAGKPTFVITNKQGQQLRTNQQIIIVTTGSNLRTVQTGGIVTSAGNNLVSLVATSQVNTLTSSSISGTSTVSVTPTGGVKMIRGVQSGTGRPITLTLPANLPNKGTSIFQQLPPKTLTLGGKAVTVQVAGSTGVPKTVTIVSSANAVVGGTVTGITAGQGTKLVMLPTKKNFVNLFSTGGQKATTVQTIQQATVQQSHDEPATTEVALAALAAEAGLLEGNSSESADHVEQMDGTFDLVNTENDNSDDDNIDDKINITKDCRKSLRTVMKAKHNRTKVLRPRYVKLGLYGGSPTHVSIGEPSSSSATKSGGNQQEDESGEETGQEQLDTSVTEEASSEDVNMSTDSGIPSVTENEGDTSLTMDTETIDSGNNTSGDQEDISEISETTTNSSNVEHVAKSATASAETSADNTNAMFVDQQLDLNSSTEIPKLETDESSINDSESVSDLASITSITTPTSISASSAKTVTTPSSRISVDEIMQTVTTANDDYEEIKDIKPATTTAIITKTEDDEEMV